MKPIKSEERSSDQPQYSEVWDGLFVIWIVVVNLFFFSLYLSRAWQILSRLGAAL